MLYDYECQCGVHFEKMLPVAMCDQKQKCPECGRHAAKIIIGGHGGILRTGDDMPWVKSAALTLGDGEKPNPDINTIQDLRKYYADNPNVVPVESHPALPSSLGDRINSKPDPAASKRERSRRAHKKLREMRSISITSRPA